MQERNTALMPDNIEKQMPLPPATQLPSKRKPRPHRAKPFVDLSEGMLENNRMTRPEKAIDVFVSAVLHAGVLAFLLLIPFLFTSALDFAKMNAIYLVAPPPPPPAAAKAVRPPRPSPTFIHHGELFAPRAIPKAIEQVKDLQPAPEMTAGAVGGVSGGIPGGQLGGVMGGILGGTSHFLPPPPARPKAPAHVGPYRVGGVVQPPVLIQKVQPVYPPLAKMTRAQGVVVIDCVIDKSGDVTQMRLVSGPPLLVESALQAVRDWKYKPTLLNGIPVSVEMAVTVQFRMDS